MTETPFFLDRSGTALFALEHVPEAAPRPTAYVLSHPFAEEKLWSHRVFVSTARALAARGHIVLRFDYSGAGDSQGETATSGLAEHRADLEAAVETLRHRHPSIERVGIVGLRLGAAVAALTAESSEAAGRLNGGPLVLWDPVMDGDAYFQELLRTNLSTQLAFYGKVRENREALTERIRDGGTVNVDGYELGRPLLDSYGVPDLLASSPKRYEGDALVVQIAATRSQKEREDLKSLAASYARGAFERVVEQPFWREIRKFYGQAADLQARTLDWLEQTDG